MKQKILDMRRYLVEIKLGLFFLVALILFFIAILSIREMSFFKGTYIVRVKFNFAEGLKPASPVRFCGVDVGEVKKLEIKKERGIPTVLVYAKIAEGVQIPLQSKFFINSLSLFGEKYLEIIPPPCPTDIYLSRGAVIRGVNSPPLFDVITATHETMSKLQQFVTDSDLKGSFNETIANINTLATELTGLIVDIRDQRGTVGRFLYDDSIYEKADELLDDLKKHPWKLLYKPKERKR